MLWFISSLFLQFLSKKSQGFTRSEMLLENEIERHRSITPKTKCSLWNIWRWHENNGFQFCVSLWHKHGIKHGFSSEVRSHLHRLCFELYSICCNDILCIRQLAWWYECTAYTGCGFIIMRVVFNLSYIAFALPVDQCCGCWWPSALPTDATTVSNA